MATNANAKTQPGDALTVRELIAELKEQDPDAVVVMSSDAEGNHYSPCRAAFACRYIMRSGWAAEIDHPTEEQPTWSKAVVLFPVN